MCLFAWRQHYASWSRQIVRERNTGRVHVYKREIHELYLVDNTEHDIVILSYCHTSCKIVHIVYYCQVLSTILSGSLLGIGLQIALRLAVRPRAGSASGSHCCRQRQGTQLQVDSKNCHCASAAPGTWPGPQWCQSRTVAYPSTDDGPPASPSRRCGAQGLPRLVPVWQVHSVTGIICRVLDHKNKEGNIVPYLHSKPLWQYCVVVLLYTIYYYSVSRLCRSNWQNV